MPYHEGGGVFFLNLYRVVGGTLTGHRNLTIVYRHSHKQWSRPFNYYSSLGTTSLRVYQFDPTVKDGGTGELIVQVTRGNCFDSCFGKFPI